MRCSRSFQNCLHQRVCPISSCCSIWSSPSFSFTSSAAASCYLLLRCVEQEYTLYTTGLQLDRHFDTVHVGQIDSGAVICIDYSLDIMELLRTLSSINLTWLPLHRDVLVLPKHLVRKPVALEYLKCLFELHLPVFGRAVKYWS